MGRTTCLVSAADVPALFDLNDTHKCHETLVIKVGAHAKVLTVTGKVVPLININAGSLVCHNLGGGDGGWTRLCACSPQCRRGLHTVLCIYSHLVQKAHISLVMKPLWDILENERIITEVECSYDE